MSLGVSAQNSLSRVDKNIVMDYAGGCEIDLDNDGLKEAIVAGWSRDAALGFVGEDIDGNEVQTEDQAWVLKYDGTDYAASQFFKTVGMRGHIIPADFNGDGNIDLFLSGERFDFPGVYLNDGNGNFALDENYAILNAFEEEIEWYPRGVDVADFNADGLPDVVGMGWSNAHNNRQDNCGVAINNGDGTFTLRATDVMGDGDVNYDFALATIRAYDLNNDGYADILVQGNVDNSGDLSDIQQGRTFQVYINVGKETDPEEVVSFYNINIADDVSHHYGNGNILVADFNNDGTPDIYVTGEAPQDAGAVGLADQWDYIPQLLTGKITVEDGMATVGYTENTQLALRRNNIKVLSSTNVGIRAIDYNADGYYDVLTFGWCTGLPDGTPNTQAAWLLKGSDRGLTDYSRIPGASEQAVLFLDYGVEGALNYLMTGYHGDNTYFTGEDNGLPTGRNCAFTKNPYEVAARPDAPTGLNAEVNGNKVALTWTPAASSLKNVTYEVYLKNTATGKFYNNVTSFVGGEKDGVRKVVRPGNAYMATSLELNLPDGTYEWGVQTVNAAERGSVFANGGTISVGQDGISEKTAEAAVEAVRYNALGQQVSAQKGVNLVKMTDGSVQKVIVK